MCCLNISKRVAIYATLFIGLPENIFDYMLKISTLLIFTNFNNKLSAVRATMRTNVLEELHIQSKFEDSIV